MSVYAEGRGVYAGGMSVYGGGMGIRQWEECTPRTRRDKRRVTGLGHEELPWGEVIYARERSKCLSNIIQKV